MRDKTSANDLAPSLYLKWVFENIGTMRPEDLLPWSKLVLEEHKLLKKE